MSRPRGSESATASESQAAATATQKRAAPLRVLARIEAAAPAFGPSDARVAGFLLERPDAAIYQSVSEVADAARTSTATVVRFAQKLGFKGYHELKLALAQDLAAFDHLSGEHDEGSVLERVTSAGAQSVRDAEALVSIESFESAVAILDSARRGLWVGVGTSAPLAQDAAYRFRAVGIESDAPADVHVQHVSESSSRSARRVRLDRSHGFDTRDSRCRRGGQGSRCFHDCDHKLSRLAAYRGRRRRPDSGFEGVSFRLEAMASRLAQMAIVDALLVAVAERDQEQSERALDLYTDVLGEHRL